MIDLTKLLDDLSAEDPNAEAIALAEKLKEMPFSKMVVLLKAVQIVSKPLSDHDHDEK